ncbi:MAG: 30S ribosomal protein S21 [Candidatus Latescibacterota bacterium]|nr:MAG: 30S ribosomal protein S21 [Candidatus Latescibacterota bacterium]RKY63792.1 MAG: 30S ribosomal protein S21 [Candidatus Latescibacterota bacterium]HDI00593.1 30S ribosomal protein S21 [Bacillota bacterium]
MIHVTVREGEDVEQAIKRFRRKCEQEGIIKEIKNHRFYEKPSERRRKAQSKALRKLRKAMFMQQKKGS